MQTNATQGRAWAIALIALIFISKISFRSLLPFIPKELSVVLFQGGLHPYLNFIAVMGLGVILILRSKPIRSLSPIYLLFCWGLIGLLGITSILQIMFSGTGLFATLGTFVASSALIGIYGLRIPKVLDIEETLDWIFRCSSICVFLSLLVFAIFPENAWKGGRFIGVFKHIPHMVTCASVAFIFSLDFSKHKIWKLFTIPAALYLLLLTGTRSSLAAVLMAVILVTILIKTKSIAALFLKSTGIIVAITYGIFFGPMTVNYLEGIARGERALMEREAQDGVASRMEEVERGWELFQLNPWLGSGLASKFSNGDETSVDKYNANKDPHNIFVSAGVIGGWAFLVYSIYAVIILLIGTMKGLASKDSSQRMVAIYLATHLPILIIYHVHLSPGGVADRIYWLLFGLLAL